MINNICETCDKVAEYITTKGGWFLCRECITLGKFEQVGA